jgi:hypothetical protein
MYGVIDVMAQKSALKVIDVMALWVIDALSLVKY